MREDEFDIAYRILDDDLIDSDGRRCGKVDDVELDGEPGEASKITAILCGPGVFARRLPGSLEGAVKRLFGSGIVTVPWSAVDDVSSVVTLKQPAGELGLGAGDDSMQPIVAWAPGSDR